MKRSDHGLKAKKNITVYRCIALLLVLSIVAALVLPDHDILPTVKAAIEDDSVTPSENTVENKLIAFLDFNSDSDRLKDLSGENVQAALEDSDYIIGTEDDGTEEGNSYLDLTRTDGYLELPGSLLKGLTEMTVEMQVKTEDTANANWPFFAAVNGAHPASRRNYLGVLLNSGITVERYSGDMPSKGDITAEWTVNEWHTVKIVFGAKSTLLYIDGDNKGFKESDYTLADCLGSKQENGTYNYNEAVLWFGHSAWGEGFNGCIDNITISGISGGNNIDSGTEKVIVSLDFEDTKGGRLANKAGNSNDAKLTGDRITADFDLSDYFNSETENDKEHTYLDLMDKKAYLSLTDKNGKGVLNGLKEMTVEMRIKTNDTDEAHWSFFAAPNDVFPGEPPTYFGVFLKNSTATVERFSKERTPVLTTEWTAGTWHTVKVVFKISSTVLCIDGKFTELGTVYSLEKCVGTDGVLWLGHSAWGEYFNGCIDYVKIWNYANYESIEGYETIKEEEFIITDSVTEPKYTTVNLFDYWITEPTLNDYNALDGNYHNTLLQGINEDHLFLFAGENAFGGRQATAAEIGFWNRICGEIPRNPGYNNITQNIVHKTLKDGYPVLALDILADSGYTVPNEMLSDLKKLWNDNANNGKRTESLAYLFDPTVEVKGKASYPNVTGLFQMNDKGYYTFHSWDTFAELNVEQVTGPKYSTPDNHITLYNKIWGWGQPGEHDGQFFPFNDWSDMFYVNGKTAEGKQTLEQAHKNDSDKSTNGYGQTTTDEPLNHYFGMTVETTFQQPVDGMLDSGEAMKFDFSGDDDVWVFIDDVLVADLGGIHGWKKFSINFATGEINFEELNPETPTDKDNLMTFQTLYLADMFESANPGSTDNWNTINSIGRQAGDPGRILPDNSIHTMKFFYLERGNQYSNCNITFNLLSAQPDVIHKADENGKSLEGAIFELYAAKPKNSVQEANANTADEFERVQKTVIKVNDNGEEINEQVDELIATVSCDEDKNYKILDDEGNPVVFAKLFKTNGYKYYILHEKKAPEGYRTGKDIILKYDTDTKTFAVVNGYETGAYASFSAYLTQLTNNVYLAGWDNEGNQTKGTTVVDKNKLNNGLVFVVPTQNYNDTWLPLYGSNADGWTTVNWESGKDYRQVLLKAALKQLSLENAPNMQMTMDTAHKAAGVLTANLQDLPGSADSYKGNGGSKYSYATLLVQNITLDELKRKEAEAVPESDLMLLYTGSPDFERTYSSDIHVADMPQQLVIRKVNADNEPLEGAVFALYNNAGSAYSKAENEENRLAYGKTDENGILCFGKDELGLEDNVYWLREIKAPAGYLASDYLIRVVVEKGCVYVDATAWEFDNTRDNPQVKRLEKETEDNVKVYAAVGTLAQSAVRFTDNNGADVLADITGAVNKAEDFESTSSRTLNWVDTGGSYDLHYYGNDESFKYNLLDYAVNDYGNEENLLDALGVAVTEDGFIRVKPTIDVNGKVLDLSSMFSMLNIVEITDEMNIPIKSEVNPGEGETVKLGEIIEYSITGGNYSADTADVTIEDTLDIKVDFVSASYGDDVILDSSHNEQGDGGVTIIYDSETRTVKWVFTDVPSGENKVVGLTVKVNENIKNTLNTGNAVNAKGEITVDNQAAVIVNNEKYYTKVITNPVAVVDLDIEKKQALGEKDDYEEKRTTKPLKVTNGDLVTYYLTVKVIGTEGEELSGIVVQDMVPEGLELVDGSIGIISPDSTTGTDTSFRTITYKDETVEDENVESRTVIEWRLGNGKVGDEFTLFYTVKVSDDIYCKNIAYVRSDLSNESSEPYPGTPDDPGKTPRDPWKPSNIVVISNIEPLEIQLPDINKTLEGREWINTGENKDTFSFVLKGYDTATVNAITKGDIIIGDGVTKTVVISEEETHFPLGSITFNIAGDFMFSVTEVDDHKGGIKYDKTEYVITVKIANENETLVKKSVTVSKNGGTGVDVDEKPYTMEFENSYNAEGSWAPSVTKNISGRPWTAKDKFEFALELISVDNEPEEKSYDSLIIKGEKYKGSTVPAKESFGEVAFTKPGSYIFKLSEVQTSDKDGMVYDKGYYELTVEVDDKLNGELEASLVEVKHFIKDTEGYVEDEDYSDTDGIIFTNAYSAKVSWVPTVTKEISGRPWTENDEFEFALELISVNKERKDEPYGSLTIKGEKYKGSTDPAKESFGEVTFTEPGSYIFKLSEVQSDDKDGMVYDKGYYELTVEVTDKEFNGVLETSLTDVKHFIKDTEGYVEDEDYSDTDGIIFTNAYSAKVSWAPTVTKKISGRPWTENDEFEFALELISIDGEPKDESYGSLIIEGKNHKDSTTEPVTESFGEVPFTKPGSYIFKLSEVQNGDKDGMVYDKGYYELTVDVTDEKHNGELEISLTDVKHFIKDTEGYVKDEDYSGTDIIFTNTYSASTTISVPIEKKLSGKTWEKEEFEFTITPDSKTAQAKEVGIDRISIPLVSSSSSDSFKLTFMSNGSASTTYTFTVAETDSKISGMTYAEPYTLTVEVTDNMKGNMTAVAYVVKDNSKTALKGSLTFENTYKAPTTDPPSSEEPPTVPPSSNDPTKEPTLTEATMTEPTSTEVATTEPTLTEATTTEPTSTEAATTEPPMTEAATTEPPMTEATTTEAAVTEPPITEPPVTVPVSPPENYPPATSDNNFNLDDDGPPRGNESLSTDDNSFNLDDDGNPSGDLNMPTGVVVGGSVGVAAVLLIAAAAAQTVGKRRHGRKDK